MLKLFTRLEKTRNFILLLFAILMVASLVFFYSPTRGDIATNPAQSTEVAASVSGENITVGDIARQQKSSASSAAGGRIRQR